MSIQLIQSDSSLKARFTMQNLLFAQQRYSVALLLLASTLFFSSNIVAAPKEETLIDHELQLHIDLVSNALQTDSYNKRCRGMSISKSLNQVNRLLVTKYSLTSNNFIKNYIAKDVEAFKSERYHDFNKNLNLMGGCKVAKSEGIVKQLKKEFRDLYDQAEKSPWYPD